MIKNEVRKRYKQDQIRICYHIVLEINITGKGHVHAILSKIVEIILFMVYYEAYFDTFLIFLVLICYGGYGYNLFFCKLYFCIMIYKRSVFMKNGWPRKNSLF